MAAPRAPRAPRTPSSSTPASTSSTRSSSRTSVRPIVVEGGDPTRIGYARVSTGEQNPDHQVDALTRAGCGRIYLDHASGAKASRPAWDITHDQLRAGDTLVITRLDRMGRSVLHLVTVGAELRERDVGLQVLEQGIDTATAEGRAMFGMLAVLAELQRELIVDNTRDGLAAARARGRVGGRPTAMTPAKLARARELLDARQLDEHQADGRRLTMDEIARTVGVSRRTLYRALDIAANQSV